MPRRADLAALNPILPELRRKLPCCMLLRVSWRNVQETPRRNDADFAY
jgi:hypothetical protein